MKLIYRQHAVRRMFERSISTAEVAAALGSGRVIEEYPADTPYPSCLWLGFAGNRPLHLVFADLLNDEPGLTPEISQAFDKAYRKARLLAARETGMEEATFPKQSPYTIEQTMADDYLPEGN